MKCSIDGCERTADYKEKALCQKHYFRVWRNGTVKLKLEEKRERLGYSRDPKVVMPGKGYVRVYLPEHPLRDSAGYVAEHRVVVYQDIGDSLSCCELCGKHVDWKTVHIDHIDRNVQNNERSNLRPLCRVCNTFRDYPDQCEIAGRNAITMFGETKTAQEWGRDDRVAVSGNVIRQRLRRGLSVNEAFFSAKQTHNGNVAVDRRPRKTTCKAERSNAVAVTIDGRTLSAAEWAREEGCQVGASGIIFRLRSGWEPKDAVFAPKRMKLRDLQQGRKAA